MNILEWFKKQLKIERKRYSRARKLMGLLIYFLLYFVVPPSLKIIKQSYFSQDNTFYIFTISFCTAFTLIVWNSIMYFIYTLKIPFFEQYRVNISKKWPWQENKQVWNKLLKRSLSTTSFYIFIFVPFNLWISTKLHLPIKFKDNQAPSIQTFFIQLFIMMIVQDFLFYTSHRMFHHPLLYKYHKVHHQFTTSISIAGLHFHVIQFFIGQSLSASINMKIVQMFYPLHISTFAIWVILRIWDANNGHSGYNFSWAPLQVLPFCTYDQFHDFHHSNNSGNYGSHFRILDAIFKSSNEYQIYKKQKQT